MEQRLKHEAMKHGDTLAVVSVECLQTLNNELTQFRHIEALNNFQQWIVDHMYRFELPATDFPIRSLILVAIPHPAYANVAFGWQGNTYHVASMIMSDFPRTERYMHDVLTPEGFHFQYAPDLPLKRLAVHSGLATYGRNNICYVEGMGSFLSFGAYFSDIPCESNDWTDLGMAEQCGQCMICVRACPTEAIQEHRFLLENERCLSYFNENPDPFPEWMSPSVHHCVYDCLRCQLTCPMNTAYSENIVDNIRFCEDETTRLLSGCPFDAFPEALQQKAKLLGFDRWLRAIPRNLQVLFELHEPTRTEISMPYKELCDQSS